MEGDEGIVPEVLDPGPDLKIQGLELVQIGLGIFFIFGLVRGINLHKGLFNSFDLFHGQNRIQPDMRIPGRVPMAGLGLLDDLHSFGCIDLNKAFPGAGMSQVPCPELKPEADLDKEFGILQPGKVSGCRGINMRACSRWEKGQYLHPLPAHIADEIREGKDAGHHLDLVMGPGGLPGFFTSGQAEGDQH